jgi:taurine dioxygenase
MEQGKADAEITVSEMAPGFGARIEGLDLAAASDQDLEHAVSTFHRHGALLLRGQKLSPGEFRRFGMAFGELEGHAISDFVLPYHPEIYVLSNRTENGKPVGAHNDGIGWHTDYAFRAEPVMCTMLYAIAVPDEGSDTLLADQCAAWNALPEERRRELEGLKMRHSYAHLMETREHGRKEVPPEALAAHPDVDHPLVRTHPADGRKALWVSGGTRGIVGMDPEASEALIDELIEFTTQDRFVHRHRWQVGDVLVWDNRCTLHTGTLFDDKCYIREMHRMWVRGDRPC